MKMKDSFEVKIRWFLGIVWSFIFISNAWMYFTFNHLFFLFFIFCFILIFFSPAIHVNNLHKKWKRWHFIVFYHFFFVVVCLFICLLVCCMNLLGRKIKWNFGKSRITIFQSGFWQMNKISKWLSSISNIYIAFEFEILDISNQNSWEWDLFTFDFVVVFESINGFWCNLLIVCDNEITIWCMIHFD